MADTLESLEIKVKHSASGADVEINSLAKAIGNLQKELSGLSVESMKGLVNSFKASAEALKGAKTGQLTKFAEAMADVAASAEMLGDNSEAIGKLAEAMTAVSGVKVYAGAFNSLATGVKNVGEASKTLTSESLENLEKMVTTLSKLQGVDLQGLGSAMSAVGRNAGSTKAETPIVPVSVGLQEIISTASAVDVLEAKLESLKIAMEEAFAAGDADKAYALRGQILQTEAALEKARGAANKTEKETNRLADAMKRLKDSVTRANGPLARFFSSLKRIAFYRMIRSVIKEITEAFSEGLKNAYLFSAGLTTISGHRFAAAMDTMNSKATQMKSQLGSAFISLLTAIEPVISRIIDLAIQAADAISQLLAAFTGNTYLKAAKVTDSLVDDFKSGAGAAKEWKNQILGFDVINRLNENGTTGLSASDLFGGEESEIEQKWKDLAETIKSLKFTIDDVLFDWGDLTGEQIAEKALAGLFGLTGAVVGFALGGVPGAIVGSILGVAFGIYIDDLLFHQTGEKRSEVLSSLATALFGIAGGMLGFFVGGPAGAALGIIAGAGIGLMISSALFSKGRASSEEFFKTLLTVLGAISGGMIGFFLGGPAGGVIGMVVGAAIGMVIASALFDKNSSASKEKFAQTLIIALGMIAGALIGFAVLPTPVGAVLGATIGVAISLLVVSTLFDDNGASFKDKILASLVVTLGAVAGMLIGFFVGGAAGAAIGATIGVAITLWAVDVAWDAKSKAKIEAERENVFDDYVKGTFDNPSTGNVFADYATGNMEDPLSWMKTIPGLASGGFPDTGLFYAYENGPEMVGTIGGRTAVATNDDIVAAVSQGVANAVASVMGNGSERPLNVRVYLDSREIKTGQRNYSRAMGV